MQVTRLGCASVHERIVLETGDGAVRRYTIHSEARDCANEAGTDFAALAAGYISITPLHFDLVDPRAFELLEGWKLERGRGGGAAARRRACGAARRQAPRDGRARDGRRRATTARRRARQGDDR